MTEIYEVQVYTSEGMESIKSEILKVVVKVGNTPHENHDNNFYFIVDDKGQNIEYELVENNHRTTAEMDKCYNSIANEVLQIGKNHKREHIKW